VIGHVSTTAKAEACRIVGTANLVTRTPNALKTLDPGPPPTCPFIYFNNVKERKMPTPNVTPFYGGLPGICNVAEAAEPFGSSPRQELL
jgi:hypothetical protein